MPLVNLSAVACVDAKQRCCRCKKSCQVCGKAPVELQALISQKAAAAKDKIQKQAAEPEQQPEEQRSEQKGSGQDHRQQQQQQQQVRDPADDPVMDEQLPASQTTA